MTDLAVQALLMKIPEAGTVWPAVEREKWLLAMGSVFDLVYLESAPPIPDFVVKLPEKALEPLSMAESAGEGSADDEKEADEEVVEPPAPNARPGSPRPKGIPTTFEMVRTILLEKSGLNSRDVVTKIAERWWPGCHYNQIGPEISTYVTEKLLLRDLDGMLTVSDRGKDFQARKPFQTILRKTTQVAKSVSAPAPKPVSPPAQQPVKTRVFVYGSKPVDLTLPEFEVAEALRNAMGKGFLDYRFLGLRGREVGAPRTLVPDKQWLAAFMPGLSAKLEKAGLLIEHRENFGYEMKRV